MKDKSKRLTVVNTEKKPSEKKEIQQVIVQPSSSSSSHAPGFNPNLYLLKSVWDSVFEIKTDVSGQKYIFGKLPVVTKYGITMYADDGNVDIPQLAEGLPFDQRTIWFNPETKQIEVIGGTGGGGEGGVSNFWDLSGIPSWITNAKPTYSYSEILGTPDLSVFVTGTALNKTLADYATLTYLTGELKKYVTLDGAQDIKGIKNFVNGLKIANMPITKLQDDVIYIDANLVVRGGITMYGDGEGGSSVPVYSTLGSLENVDKDAIDAVASVDRVLFQSAGSNVWSWKALSEIGGGGSVSGDYLPLSGGELSGSLAVTAQTNGYWNGGIRIDGTASVHPSLAFHVLNVLGSRIYVDTSNTKYDLIYELSTFSPIESRVIIHSSNYSSYALPLSGGTLTNTLTISNTNVGLRIFRTTTNSVPYINFGQSESNNYGAIGVNSSGVPIFQPLVSTASGYGKWNAILHAGNYSSYALPLSGGTITGGFGALSIKVNNNYGQCIKFENNSSTMGYLGFNSNNKAIIYEGSDISGSSYDIIHNGNISSYNAGSATKLQTARTIWGQSFDGTGNVNGILTLNYNSSTSGIELTREGSNESSIAFNNGYGRSVIGSWGGGTHLWIQGLGNILTANMTTGNVGIGTPSPSEKLQVEGNCWLKNGRLYALYASFDDISSITDRVNYTAARIGTFDRTEGGFVIQLGKHDVSNAGWRQQFSIINSGWTETLFSVDRSGNVIANGGITMYSDIRKKTKLQDVELSLSQIANAPLIQHYYNSDQNKTTHVGSIAQYWAELNDWFCKLDAEGFYTMEIQNAALASAISIARHLEKYESKTDKKIRMLKKRVQELEDKLEKLEGGKYGCN